MSAALRKRLTAAALTRLILTGDAITANSAESMGLVDEVVPTVADAQRRAQILTRRLAQVPSETMVMAKKVRKARHSSNCLRERTYDRSADTQRAASVDICHTMV